jgi:hypothetical protein
MINQKNRLERNPVFVIKAVNPASRNVATQSKTANPKNRVE